MIETFTSLIYRNVLRTEMTHSARDIAPLCSIHSVGFKTLVEKYSLGPEEAISGKGDFALFGNRISYEALKRAIMHSLMFPARTI